MKVAIVDTLGVPIHDVFVMVFKNGGPVSLRQDRFGNRFFLVMDSDTLDLLVHGRITRFPVAGLDSVIVTLRIPESESRPDSIHHIEPVSVVGQRQDETVDTGLGAIRKASIVTGVVVDMKSAEHYHSLVSFLLGRVAGLEIDNAGNASIRRSKSPPLIILDGQYYYDTSLKEIDSMIIFNEIGSIYVSKDGAGFGVRGWSGVIVITTKTGRR